MYVSRTKYSKEIWKTLDHLNINNGTKKNINIPYHLKNPDLINKYFIDSVQQITNTVDHDTICHYLNKNCTSAEFELELIKKEEVPFRIFCFSCFYVLIETE